MARKSHKGPVPIDTVPANGDQASQTAPGIDMQVQDTMMSQLAKTIEGEIIPRLLLAHAGTGRKDNVTDPRSGFVFEEVQRFAGLTFASDPSRCYAFLDRVRSDGASLETIIMDLLGPSAAYLGELWKNDLCTFTEVTVGLSRLRHILREISPAFESESHSWRHGRRALLLPTPGDQHSFGVVVVETFFRREGWDVWGEPLENADDIANLVENQWFAIAGFSLSSERFLDVMTTLIRQTRRCSCNREIGILVGGPLFNKRPDLVASVGADSYAVDGREAVIQARALLGRVAARP